MANRFFLFLNVIILASFACAVGMMETPCVAHSLSETAHHIPKLALHGTTPPTLVVLALFANAGRMIHILALQGTTAPKFVVLTLSVNVAHVTAIWCHDPFCQNWWWHRCCRHLFCRNRCGGCRLTSCRPRNRLRYNPTS